MTYYGYNNLPEEMGVKPLPIGIFNSAKDAFLEALESGHILQLEAKAAYAYEYKGEMNLYSFTDTRNTGNNTDDVIIQLAIRMSNPEKAHNALALTTKLVDSAAEHTALIALGKNATQRAEIVKAELEARQAECFARETQQRMADVRMVMNAQLAMAEECAHEAAILAREKQERLESLRKK